MSLVLAVKIVVIVAVVVVVVSVVSVFVALSFLRMCVCDTVRVVSREVDRACAPCASLKSLFRIKCWGAGENRLGRRRVGFTPASSQRIGGKLCGGEHWREGPKVEYSPREATRADPGEYGVG